MNLQKTLITCGLSATGVSANPLTNGQVGIGGLTRHAEAEANAHFAIRATAGAALDEVGIDLASGLASADAGAPDVEGSGRDFEGKLLPTIAAVLAMRIRTSGPGTVTLSGDLVPGRALPSGSDVVTRFAGGVSPGTVGVLFSAEDGEVLVEVVGIAD